MAEFMTTLEPSVVRERIHLFVGLLVTLGFCVSGRSTEASQIGGAKLQSSVQASTYVFVAEQSSVVQTGGIAGIHETYPVEGQFRLWIDFGTSKASFLQVSAHITGESGFLPTQDLGTLLNMTGLVATVVADSTIIFAGKTDDGTKTDIRITLTFSGDSVRLTGQTIPPAGSADFFVFNLDALAGKKYDGGTGEAESPYLISTAEHLNAIGTAPGDWNASFKLNADIDLSSITGSAFNIIGSNEASPFTGEFDGNGYRISNFNYTSDDRDYLGVFGCVGWDGRIRDLLLVDAAVDGGKGDYVGSLAGCLAGGVIVDCASEDAVVSGKRYVGGLVGRNTASSGGMLEILAVGSIETSSSGGTISGNQDIGGIAGANSGLITNCFSTANVSGTTGVGGLAGSNNHGQGPAEIANCYSVGPVVGTARVGGFVGHNNSEVVRSFWDIQTSGQTTSDGGSGRTMAQMQAAEMFLAAGWDLLGEDVNGTDDIWRICDIVNYPRLAWQIRAGDFVCPDGITAHDFLFLTERWLNDGCNSSNDYCRGADLDFSGAVDADDLAIFLDIWLAAGL